MKKFFKEALKPDQPFEEWAKAHNIKVAKKPISKKPAFFKQPILRWATAVASLLLIFAIILPFALLDNDTDLPSEPRIYSSNDISSKNIELNELFDLGNLLLVDFEQIIQVESIIMEYVNDDKELIILSYNISKCLLYIDENYTFYIDYIIRIYPNYEFYSFKSYNNLEHTVNIANIDVSYKIDTESLSEKSASINFTFNERDYFLCVSGFDGVTEITDETINILLNNLLQ